jgi:hypothetical protein
MVIHVMPQLYLISPLFLGDAFVINALVHKWAQEAVHVHVPTLPQYVHTVQCLYSDYPNITVVPYLGEQKEQEYIAKHNLQTINFRTLYELTKLPIKHHDAPVDIPVLWDRQIYEYFDVPFSRRYQNFQLPKHIPNTQNLFNTLNPTHEPYVLWHRYSHTQIHDTQVDLKAWRAQIGAPDIKIIEIVTGHTANLLDYMQLITHAQEIHCIPSAFHCLVDSVLDQTNATLFYHDVKAHTLMQVNCRWNNWRWHSVYYEHKI